MKSTHAGKLIRKFRKERGLSERRLARAIGVETLILKAIENGRRVPDDRILTALKENLGLGLEEWQQLVAANAPHGRRFKVDLSRVTESQREYAAYRRQRERGDPTTVVTPPVGVLVMPKDVPLRLVLIKPGRSPL